MPDFVFILSFMFSTKTQLKAIPFRSPSYCRYLKELRQNSNVFPTESLILIFSNIEKIFRFQQKFLDGLRYGIEHNKIAETFLEFVSFRLCLFSFYSFRFRYWGAATAVAFERVSNATGSDTWNENSKLSA